MFLFFIIGIVDIGDSCGETITLGDKTKNGFINLFNKAGPPDSLPDLCEVYLPAKQGLSLHIRFIVSGFRKRDKSHKLRNLLGCKMLAKNNKFVVALFEIR